MVIVNGEEFPVYQLDTPESITIRIASSMGTIPEYLYYPKGFPSEIDEDTEIVVEDLLELIKESDTTNFRDFLKSIEPKLPKKIDLKRDVLIPWLIYNKKIEQLYQFSPAILTQQANDLVENDYFDSVDEVQNIWGRKKILRDELDRRILFNNNNKDTYLKLYQAFQDVEEGIGYTEFSTNRVTLLFNLDLEDITLLEIFNHIILNERVPFATVKNYYKILKDFIPPEEWSQESDNIIVKVGEKVDMSTIKHKEYADVKVEMEGEKVITKTRLITERGYLSRDQFLEKFMGIFHGLGNITYSNVNEMEVVGIFYFPFQRINTYVFSDLVMNDTLFSSLINIDESSKATKKKGEVGQPWLHIHFDHPSTGHITAGISQKTVDRSELEMRSTDPEIFPHGEAYIRVRVRGKDRKSVEIFQEMLSKLFVIYEQKYDEIAEFYQKYLPDFGVFVEGNVKPLKEKPSDIAPNIFVKNYSRTCPDERIPKIITKEEAKEHDNVMIFPRDIQQNEPKYASDGVDQKYYICTNPDYPNPGVRVNRLSNSKEYPYIPCCFKENQRKKKGGHYKKYYNNDLTYNQEKRQQELIRTDKILGSEQYGLLPDSLEKIFDILNMDQKYRYIRVGVERNPSSFLSAVLSSLHEETGFLNLSDKEKKKEIKKIRKRMAKENIVPLARQSVYDENIEQIQKELLDIDAYLDPKKYTQLLETFFNCNIFLFNREKLFLPNHVQSYYKNYNDAPCIFIYEHMGSESDRAEYPQCELIIRWHTKKSDDTQYVFPYDQNVSKGINKIFQILRDSYALDTHIDETVFNIPDEVKILSQEIDSYGKTRRLNVQYGENITILTSPIPPIAVKETKSDDMIKVSSKVALSLLRLMDAKEISQKVIRNMAVEIHAMVSNVSVTIPIETENVLDGLSISRVSFNYSENEGSDIATYNRNKKLARYITEYSFWLFSRFMKKKGVEKIDDDVLATFAKKRIKIIPDFKYDNIPKKFSTKSGVMDGGRLVVTSEDMLKRLLYVVKLYSIRDTRALVNYYTHNVITNYYVDLTDFTFYPNQVILYGDDSVDKWIQENKFTYTMNSEVLIGQRSPYFFKNEMIEDKVFLAQNVDNLETAFHVARTWQRDKYNPGPYYQEKHSYNFTLYTYGKGDSMIVKEVKGKRSLPDKLRILGYKLSDTPYYTVLLDL